MPKQKCKNKRSLNRGFCVGKIHVEYYKVLRMLYGWIYNYTLYREIGMCKVSENTYIGLKDAIFEKFGEEPEDDTQIGGECIRVQLDKTSMCNGIVVELTLKHRSL
ncbi:hypothetical protein NGRA_1190 [Nosema granulosis]|uniref:Uncharacterized protein n=1 Tax=Nosema granulosis TaxID=83296 RepID=A0A9P6KZL5_9MICR|nr:hypothetical protein NGRA_1190 [Nosema granulosis]